MLRTAKRAAAAHVDVVKVTESSVRLVVLGEH